jgi:RimJ/RimL family protein N-acetyltransferase
MRSQPTLPTDHLILRPITMADWDAYAAMWLDPRVTTFIGGAPRPTDVAWPKFGQAAAMWSLFGYGNWSVIDRADGTYLGVAGLSDFKRGIPELDGYPEGGWAFAAASWGRGVASEALTAIHEWADEAGIAETRCMIDDGNAASIKVAERVGYVPFASVEGDRRVFRRRAPSKG